MAQLNFNAAAVQPASAFDPIPAGWYPAQITESEMKPTKDGSGAYLALTFTILGGQYANRKIFGRLNLQNRNPVAVEIAEQQLSAICHATGVIQLQDSSQLHGIPLDIKVKVRAADGTYEATNELSGFRALQQAAPAVGGGAPVGGIPMAGVANVQPARVAAPAMPAGGWAAPAAQVPTQPAAPASVQPAQQVAQQVPTQPAQAAPAAAPWQTAQVNPAAQTTGAAVGGGAPVATAQPGVAPWATQAQTVSPAQNVGADDIPF